MIHRVRLFQFLVSALLLDTPQLHGADPGLQIFLDSHCVKCHGGEEQKGDLRLDTLGQHPTGRETWLAVLEAVETGDMPPKKESRPDQAAVSSFVTEARKMLAADPKPAALAIRRMNRAEYEATVQDLLGIRTELSEYLPEDSSVQGFDNVADGLGISPVLLEKYLEAADAAFESVFRRIEPLPSEIRRQVAMESPTNLSSVAGRKGGVAEKDGAFLKFNNLWPDIRLEKTQPIEGGQYHCRVAVWPHQPGERTLAVGIFTGPLFGSGKSYFQGMFDVTGTSENPRIIEFTTWMNEGDAIQVMPWIYPDHVSWRDREEPAPGIATVWAEIEGPLDQEFPSAAQRLLFGGFEHQRFVEAEPIYIRHRKGVKLHRVESEKPREDAEVIIRKLVQRAFRRPVEDAVVQQFVDFTLGQLDDEGHTFEQGVRAGVTAVLSSPHFVLLNHDPEVDDYTIASRLSYFLWSSMPDDELLALAKRGELRNPKTRGAQVARMLSDPRSERFAKRFTDQWLRLGEIDFTMPDGQLYPEFDSMLQWSMLEEARRFFRHVLDQDLGVRSLIHADFTFLNERLARHYGITDVKGHEEFRLVKLPPESERGGILSQAAVLKVTSNGVATSPVLRGVWLLENVLGQPVPPPPSAVPAVEPDIRGAVSVREQFSKHTSIESCARCHDRIDPPGFALEQFDAIGGFRESYRSLGEGEKVSKVNYKIGLPVDASGEMVGARRFEDFRGFREWLLEHDELVARSLARKLLIYGTGRRLEVLDQGVVEAVVEACQPEFRLQSMIRAIVESDYFVRP